MAIVATHEPLQPRHAGRGVGRAASVGDLLAWRHHLTRAFFHGATVVL